MPESSSPGTPDSSRRAPATVGTLGTPARPYIGGQAVLEGVMMRSPGSFSIVVRRRDGSLHVRERGVPDDRKGVGRWPLVRGVASLVESLKLGHEALRFSGDLMQRDFAAEEAAAEKAKAEKKKSKAGKGKSAGLTGSTLSALTLLVPAFLRAFAYTVFLVVTADAGATGDASDEAEKPKPDEGSGPRVSAGAAAPGAETLEPESETKAQDKGSKAGMAFMLVMMVGFMIALPQAAAAGVNKVLNLGVEIQSPAFQAITGAFKLTIVISYMFLMRTVLPDIRRVFQYHGAEHKTISTYEANEPLTVENARAKTTLHPRCGTTFLVMVALVSILVFTAVGSFLPKIQTGKLWLDNLIFLVEKLPFLPLIAAVTFEIQRVFARYCTTGPLRALLWPGFLVQKITTIEPDDHQLEVALASLRVTLFREDGEAGAKNDVRYASFGQLMTSDRLRRAA